MNRDNKVRLVYISLYVVKDAMLKDGVTFTVSMFTLYPAATCPTSDVLMLSHCMSKNLQQCTQEV